jgi:ribosomal protein S18 acetylase RimI-like enzyme
LSENKLPDYPIQLLKRNEIDEFLELMSICFTESLERQRINFDEVRKIILRIFNPILRGLMRLFGVKFYAYIIRDKGKMIAATTLYVAKKKGIIGNVMTHPDFRRRGFARKLFRYAVSEGERYNLEKLTLDVHAQNKGAIKLYENEGFVTNYHSGTASLDLTLDELPQKSDFVTVNQATTVDNAIIEKHLDSCFPSSYFDIRKRESLVKNYAPSKMAQRMAKRFGGQKTLVFHLSFNKDLTSDGYIKAGTSDIEAGISLSYPIISSENEKMIPYCFSEIVEQVDPNATILRISASMHRVNLFKSLQKSGFKITDESLYMHKFIEKP